MKLRYTGYRHSYQWYVEKYHLPYGAIVKAARRKWPLDSPNALLKKFIAAPGPKSDLTTLAEVATGMKSVKGKQLLVPVKIEEQIGGLDLASGLSSELQRLKDECARSYGEYRNETDPTARFALQKIYAQNVAALQRLAKPARQAEQDSANWLDRADVEATWLRCLVETRSVLESVPRRLATLPIFHGIDPILVEEVCTQEVNLVIAQLEKKPEEEKDDAGRDIAPKG